MKISLRDRIQATKFSPLYRKDFQRYVKQRDQDGELDAKIGPPWDPRIHLSKAGRRLCRKWGLQSPRVPDSPLEPFYYPEADKPCIDFSTLERASDCPAWMIDGVAYPVTFPTEDELQKPSSIGVVDSGGYRVVTHLDGKLCLLIDTSCPPDMTMDVLKEFINHYAKKTEDRKGTPTADPWIVYLMYQEGMNLWEITKKLYDTNERPVTNNRSDSRYQQVKRAKKKANEMIIYVEQEAKKRSRLPKY